MGAWVARLRRRGGKGGGGVVRKAQEADRGDPGVGNEGGGDRPGMGLVAGEAHGQRLEPLEVQERVER